MQMTRDRVEYVPFQGEEVTQRFPELLRERLQRAVHLIEPDGGVFQAAEAVFRALATNSFWAWPLRVYQSSTSVARSTETAYRFVADHRSLFSGLTRIFWGRHVELPDYFLVRRIFLALLGVVYLVAFGSLWVQVGGLIGKDGILPAADLMAQAWKVVAAQGIGPSRFHLLPTLCWFDASDSFLKFQCAAGSLLAVLLVTGIAPPLCLSLLWLLYLSLTTLGGDFFSFQWDSLLLETGFLAIFLGPFQLLPQHSRERGPPRTVLWLLRLLLFKLMFLSGVVKLASGDTTWRNLSALTYHYETQPLPNWVAWYMHQLPAWFHRGSCALMFWIELAVPFLIFMPRRARIAAGLLLAAFQLLIILTGNYTFFNWLTIALCILLLDDFFLRERLPARFIAFGTRTANPASSVGFWPLLLLGPVALLYVSVSTVQVLGPVRLVPSWASPMVNVSRWLSPFRSVNSYGLFAVMTVERPEIVVEGSTNGREWKEYDFPYKPGGLKKQPAFVAPYQPRLDWQMWFAALGDYRQNPWLIHFCVRLLQGSPDVLALMKQNPFPGQPPKYIRARLYDYKFTTHAERAGTGVWWKRTLKGEYLPPISLEMVVDNGKQEFPHIVEANYIDLSQISSISRFRSSEGHDYSDSFESCRNMKHYFRPKADADWGAIRIFSPVAGVVTRTEEEWAGTKIDLQPDGHSEFLITIFHVRLGNPLRAGDRVAGGQQLGFHVGKEPWSDIAVSLAAPNGRKLVSYFEVMSDSVFGEFRKAGVLSRDSAIISREARDSDPLRCIGEGQFVGRGHLHGWIDLTHNPSANSERSIPSAR
jgi:lipase maturation factor 1